MVAGLFIGSSASATADPIQDAETAFEELSLTIEGYEEALFDTLNLTFNVDPDELNAVDNPACDAVPDEPDYQSYKIVVGGLYSCREKQNAIGIQLVLKTRKSLKAPWTTVREWEPKALPNEQFIDDEKAIYCKPGSRRYYKTIVKGTAVPAGDEKKGKSTTNDFGQPQKIHCPTTGFTAQVLSDLIE